ncbi:hypothetical protein ABZS66_22965 [Dactylosporangium sp. NPDC005572]|uniref:hypothetical protein n=1 Tax=Dactylosporangium sp. NPDC005572 TaxID=3156889 RepID=UPI0033B1D4AF
MATAPHGDQQIAFASEVHRVDHVGRSRTSDNESGVPVEHAVVHDATLVITGIIRCDERTVEVRAKCVDPLVGDSRFATVEPAEPHRHSLGLQPVES